MPVERTSPDEWARKNRTYPLSAPIPGPREAELTPYIVPFVRAFDDPGYETIVFACGSQMGKTDAVLDVIGQRFDQRPVPTLYVGPSQDFVRDEIEPRVMALIDQSPSLTEKLLRGKRNTRFRKLLAGVPLRFAWAGSATQLSGVTVALAMVDELDRMMDNVKREGDPLGLVRARAFTYRDRKYGVTSTPKLGVVETTICARSGLEFWARMHPDDIESPIWRLWQGGTMHHWAWPCPECGDYFITRFKMLHWPEKATPEEARLAAHLVCPHCGGVIEERHKEEMNRRGRYVAPGQKVLPDGTVEGEPEESRTLSLWVSGLCAPFVSFGERAEAYVRAKRSGNSDEEQAAINTGFGECYAPGGGDVPEWQEVAAHRQPYPRLTLPKGSRVLTLAVDVQADRLVYTIRGWGERATSWLIDFGELWGPTAEPGVWQDLAQLLTRPIGDQLIYRAFVDSGYRPGKKANLPVNRVYEFCRRFPRLVWPTKGRATAAKPVTVSKIEVDLRGQAKRYGLDLVLLDTDWTKSWVHERVRWPTDQPGAWHLPEDVTEDFCRQIVSEARIKTPSGRPEWVARSRNNHFLDCEAMQAGLGHMINAHLIVPERSEGEVAEKVEVEFPQGAAFPPSPCPAPKAPQERTPAPAAPIPKPRRGRMGRSARLARLRALGASMAAQTGGDYR